MTWLFTATVGDQTYTATPEAPSSGLAPVRIVSANWRDALVEDGAWPAVQDISTGELVLLFPTAEDAAWITSTTPVSLRVYRPYGEDPPVVARFTGRSSDPVIAPASDGVTVTLTLSDHLADLAEETAGEVYHAQENVEDRIVALFAEASIPPPVFSGMTAPIVVARPESPASLLQLAQEAMASSIFQPDIFDPDDEPKLYEIRPNIVPAGVDVDELDTTEPWVLSLLPRVNLADDPVEAIDAGWILFGGTWQRRKFSEVNTVHITSGDKILARASNGTGPRVVYRREVTILGSFTTHAEELAEYLLPDESWTPTWEADTFSVHLDRGPDDYWPGNLRDVRQIDGLVADHNPEGTDNWTGVITALEPRLENGRIVIDLTLSARPFALPEA